MLSVACLVGAVAFVSPWLLAVPVIGGPLVALAAAAIGWRLARIAAPLPHVNDNAPRPGSPCWQKPGAVAESTPPLGVAGVTAA